MLYLCCTAALDLLMLVALIALMILIITVVIGGDMGVTIDTFVIIQMIQTILVIMFAINTSKDNERVCKLVSLAINELKTFKPTGGAVL